MDIDYREIKRVIRRIKKHDKELTWQQSKTLIGQAKAKDYIGAERGLEKLLERGKENEN